MTQDYDPVGRAMELNKMSLIDLLVVTDGVGIVLSPEERTEKAKVIKAILDFQEHRRRAIPKTPSKAEQWLKAQKVDWTDVSLVGAALFMTILAIPWGIFALFAMIPLFWHISRSIKELDEVFKERGYYVFFKTLSLVASFLAAMLLLIVLGSVIAGVNPWFVSFGALVPLWFDIWTEWYDEQLKKARVPKKAKTSPAKKAEAVTVQQNPFPESDTLFSKSDLEAMGVPADIVIEVTPQDVAELDQ